MNELKSVGIIAEYNPFHNGHQYHVEQSRQLTGADVVIHYDPWWNLAVQNQATDRAHRIGQKKAVSVYKLIVKDSIEEKILHMQEAKQNLADEILSGETGGLASLTREELLQLIQG